MTTIRETVVQSIGEPYSVKIERGMKGAYSYEIGVKSDTISSMLADIKLMKKEVEEVCYDNTKMSTVH